MKSYFSYRQQRTGLWSNLSKSASWRHTVLKLI